MIESNLNQTSDILTELNIMNPGEIAETLRNEGIKGFPRNSCLCPLANYLFQKTGKSHVVQKTFLTVYDGDERLGSMELPASVRGFVKKYDAGKYLFLDEGKPIE